jgi:phenylpropionate dioxygenase-like ring-hydroxylating dioxygenase large terminal subunit
MRSSHSVPLGELLHDLRPFSSAAQVATPTTLPPAAYSSRELFALEIQEIRSRWLCLCRAEQLPRPGTFLSVDLCGARLLVTRDERGSLAVVSRSCRHRWMDVATGAGSAQALRCPYHGWTYGLDGQLLRAPLTDFASGSSREHLSLPRLRHVEWNGFIFATVNDSPNDFAAQVSELEHRLVDFNLSQFQTIASYTWDCPWDWKIMVENFLECYHHLGTHAATLGRDFPAASAWTDVGGESFSLVHAPRRKRAASRDVLQMPGSPTLSADQASELLVVAMYPSFVFSVTAGSLVWLRISPTAPGRILLTLHICLSPQAASSTDSAGMQEALVADVLRAHAEDSEVCAAVQQGAESPLSRVPSPLASIERPLSEFYRFLSRSIYSPAALQLDEANKGASHAAGQQL